MKKEKHRIGKLMLESLTKDQIACFLDVVFPAVDIDQYVERLKKADPDMAETVSKIMKIGYDKRRKPAVDRLASDQRTIEHWDSLWNHWDSLISEVGDEEGRYAVQDAHWKPPYFDGSALAYDLDRIAEDMLRLIDDVYGLVDNPDLFFEALDEIDSNISSYPEWMGVSYDEGCTLEVNATRCVLKWLWHSSRNDVHPGKDFLDKVYEIEDQYKMVGLDKNTCVDFFEELPDKVCREVYDCFKNDDGRDHLENVYSCWHSINHLYQERFDPTKYLETCRKHLAENWHYGRPLIDDALNQADYQKAEILLEQTFSSYLHEGGKATWCPEKSLLLDERRCFHEGNEEEVSKLLEIWAGVSKELGNKKRWATSELQSVMFHTPEDWNGVIAEYKRQRNPEVKNALDPLFTEWQTEMVRRSVCQVMDAPVSSDTWIHWLIEAELDVTGKREWFMEKLNAWLAHLREDKNAFQKQWPLLSRLTRDISKSSKLNKQYPTLFKVVLPEDSGMSMLDKVRCSALQDMGGGSCLSMAMEVWKKRLCSIIPDPAKSYKSDYSYHAQWMKALYELSPDAYNGMLAQWHKKHKRRRNLWRDMKVLRLQV